MKQKMDMAFLKDVQDLLSRRHEAHMGTHLYADHGGKGGNPAMTGNRLWLELAENTPDYYISRADNALLQKKLRELSKLIPAGLALRDNGPGGGKSVEEKSIPLVRALKASHYTAIDTSPFFAKTACQCVAYHLRDVETSIEIFDSFSSQKPPERDPAISYFGGSTIGNIVHPLDSQFPLLKLASAIKGLASQQGDYLLVSFDSNADEASLMRAYSPASDFCLNALYRAAEELPQEGFNPDIFEYAPLWNAEARQFAHYWRVKQDSDFTLGGESFSLKAGEKFLGLNSYKPSEENIAEAADLAGFEVVSFLKDESPLRLAVLKNPEIKGIITALQPQRVQSRRANALA